ncbi:phage tail tape measure protein [Polycladidibacter stylochi]|uniref:phage tail tape measure protein n=1 Tax=Polycladidibacter stylochi TaxID=1807766 RepID=UPI00082A3367|nr:phage tail tape measure protein [Pseudovibrio stylochi]
MSDLNFKMVLRFVEHVTPKAQAVARAVERMADKVERSTQDMARKTNAAFDRAFDQKRIDKRMSRIEARANKMRGKLAGALAMGAAVVAPLMRVGDFEHKMASLGNVAGLTSDKLKKIEAELRKSAGTTNQYATELLGGLNLLMSVGLHDKVGIDGTVKVVENIGKTATATGASVEHLSRVGYAALGNLNVAVDDLGEAFEVMSASGKMGGFELKDMAQHFPGLTASAKNLRMEGVDAVAKLGAALQIAMRGAADPAEAANNFKNFLAKFEGPEAVNKFKKIGIDLHTELDNAIANGKGPLEYMLVRIHDLAEENPRIIGELFGDMQVQQFLKPMIADLDDYKRIRDDSLNASGGIDQDFNRMMDTMIEQGKAAGIELDNINSRSSALLGIIKEIIAEFRSWLKVLDDFAGKNPELTKFLLTASTGLLAFGVIARVAGFSINLVAGGFTRLQGAASKLFGAKWLRRIRLLTRMRKIFTALRLAVIPLAAGLATLSAPIAAIIGLLALGAFVIWKYWYPLEAWFDGFWQGIAEEAEKGFANLDKTYEETKASLAGYFSDLGDLLGLDEEQKQKIKTFFEDAFDFSWIGEPLDRAYSQVSEFFNNLFSQEELSDEERASLEAKGKTAGISVASAYFDWVSFMLTGPLKLTKIGAEWGSSLIAGFKERWAEFKAWLERQINTLKEFFKFDFEINWPDPPDWLMNMGKFLGIVDDPQPAANDNRAQAIPPYLPAISPQVDPVTALQDFTASLGPQSLDQSKTINQTNHYTVNVTAGGGALANRLMGVAAAANNRALRDTD